MSYDKLLIMQQAKRWHRAKFACVPRRPIHPMVWVDADDRLMLYHPAMDSWQKPISPPFAWDEVTFRRAVEGLRQRAGELVEEHIEAEGVPASFYSSFVEACSDMARSASAP